MASDLDTFPRLAYFRAVEARHLFDEDGLQWDEDFNDDYGQQARVDVDLQQFATFFLTIKTFWAAMWYNAVLYLAAVGISHIFSYLSIEEFSGSNMSSDLDSSLRFPAKLDDFTISPPDEDFRKLGGIMENIALAEAMLEADGWV